MTKATLLIVLLFCIACTQPRSIQITTHSDSPCENGSTCLTLSDCLLNATSCFTSNTTVLFPPGDLSTEQVNEFVIVRDVDDLRLVGGNPSSRVHCVNKVGFGFFDVSYISIVRIQFLNCGRLVPRSLLRETLGVGLALNKVQVGWSYAFASDMILNVTFRASLFFGNVFNIRISSSVVNSSRGFGLFAFNMLGHSLIHNSSFVQSNVRFYSKTSTYHSLAGGNVFIAFKGSFHFGFLIKLVVNNTKIINGFNAESLKLHGRHHSVTFTPSGGLTVMLLGPLFYKLRVNIFNSTLDSNNSPEGGNCAIHILDQIGNDFRVNISRTNFTNGDIKRVGYYAGPTKAGGLYIAYENTDTRTPQNIKLNNFLAIDNCTFSQNYAFYGAALVITFNSIQQLSLLPVILIYIVGSTIINNRGYNSIVLVSGFELGQSQSRRLVVFKRVVINDNKPMIWRTSQFNYNPIETINTTVHIQSPSCSCSLLNCTVKDNLMQGLRIVSARNVIFGSDNYIIGNSGTNGGGMYLRQSTIQMANSSRLYIERNQAVKGGGLFSDDKQSDSCFFQTVLLTPILRSRLNFKLKVIFRNNVATSSGNSVYGGHLDKCFYVISDSLSISPSVLRNSSIVILPWDNSLTEVASDIRNLCFCHYQSPSCFDHYSFINSYPGQLITLSAVAVGQLSGTVPSVATAYIKNDPYNDQLEAQQLGTTCGVLKYRIYGLEQTTVKIYLQTSFEQATKPTEVKSLSLYVELKNCPFGFEVNSYFAQKRCYCISFLENVGVTCNIDDQSFLSIGQTWIGFLNSTKQVLAHKSCPLGNCDNNDTSFTFNELDLQCAPGHSGILCGGCRDGLSAVFGSSNCLDCSNSFISLILAFLVAGIVLVLVMIYCDLTLDRGTLNGLIFYANIVQVNRTTLFPQDHRNVLTVFIAWFNLDLGIESCFYNGMDAYARTWLQYLFPIYIWVITILIIVACWYSTIAAKICGRNAVAVLATLLLLSYTKLQRTVLESWSFTLVSAHNGSSIPVWLYDGNVAFFGARHAVLFIVAFVAAAAFLIPFTLVLLSEKLLLAKCVRLVIKFKLKPFLDVYHGAYTTKYRWWTGFMLLVRSALILAFSANVLGNPRLNLFFVVIACSGVMCFKWNLGTIYKEKLVNLIESFYLQNLLLLALSTIYITHNSSNPVQDQAVASYILVSLAFVIFLLIAGYHIFMQMKAFKNSPYWCIKKKTVDTSLPESLMEPLNDMPSEPNTPTVSYVDVRPISQPTKSQGKVRMRRESLLYSTDSL